MESVGQKLRAARLGRGLSLEDVSASTRISLKSLSALEADAFQQISSRFIYKSFVRQFAAAVGASAEAWAGELDAALSQIPESLVPGQVGAPVPPRLPGLRTPRVRLSRWISSYALLFLMLAACSSLYSMWQRARGGILQASKSVPQLALRAKSVSNAKAPAPPVSAESHAAVPPATSAPVHIEVAAIERTWLSAVIDGKEVYTGTMQANERKTLESQETARIRTGNAGAVAIVFNGKNLGSLGSKGKVETVEFQKRGYRIIRSSPAPLALATLGVASGQNFGQ